jgi:hypothetical protein
VISLVSTEVSQRFGYPLPAGLINGFGLLCCRTAGLVTFDADVKEVSELNFANYVEKQRKVTVCAGNSGVPAYFARLSVFGIRPVGYRPTRAVLYPLAQQRDNCRTTRMKNDTNERSQREVHR